MKKNQTKDTAHQAVAIVGVGAVMPGAPDGKAFWQNIKEGRNSIQDVPAQGYWNPNFYYDPDPQAADRSYTKIGGFSTNWDWNPLAWKLPIPPKVSDAMDRGQKWAIMCAREALMDYGWPSRQLDTDRTGVILGNAMGGDLHYWTATRVFSPEIVAQMERSATFQNLSTEQREQLLKETRANIANHFPTINEDTMPGELSNITAGRVAAMFDLHGPNFVTDAACASAMAALSAAVEGLIEGRYDAVLTGGVDANMSPSSFIKFCKIGALSATGSRPFDADADGFVMGEGGALFLLKRLADAEANGDKIYAVIRGIGGSSDGKGKGITAPNPVGQKFAVARGWENAGCIPDQATLIEGHGTSTRVGDVAEAESLIEVLNRFGLEKGTVPLGSVKSNIGHLKSGAGAASLFKAALALHEKVLPPSINFNTPNPKIDWANAPFYVNTQLKDWDKKGADVRRAGVSSFGFGGTNFHIVMEEYIPGRLVARQPMVSIPANTSVSSSAAIQVKAPLRGALLLSANSEAELSKKLKETLATVEKGNLPKKNDAPLAADLAANYRLAIDWDQAADLTKKLQGAQRALDTKNDAVWRALKAQGVFFGKGKAQKVAFLYTGQGSQYVNMMRELKESEAIVTEVFEEADQVMTPLLGKKLTDYIYVDPNNKTAIEKANEDLMQTAITQPAVLATDQSLTKLMAAYGIKPDMVMGHSLGEYGALVAAGALPFADALEAVSARGREMTKVSVEDNGLMAAVFAPLSEIEKVINAVKGYAVIANINSSNQAVIGGSTPGVKEAAAALEKAGFQVRFLPVSHAFHTKIVAPASKPLQEVLRRLDIAPPSIPLVANTTGEFYPMRPGVEEEIVDILGQQIASPVQFVKGLHTLYDAGCRVFVEMGPKKALHGFVEDVLKDKGDVLALYSNHPKLGDIHSFNQALCGLFAAGHGVGRQNEAVAQIQQHALPQPAPSAPQPTLHPSATPATANDTYQELGKLFADFLDRGMEIYSGKKPSPKAIRANTQAPRERLAVVTGAALGLPGLDKVFDDENIERLLRGEQMITPIPMPARQAQIDKKIVRLVKDHITGAGEFVTIESVKEAIKLAGIPGAIDIALEFGYPSNRAGSLDMVTKLAIGAGIQALRDAGIPLVRTYKTTTKGTFLPDRWMLPKSMQDDTGVVIGSAFAGYESFADEMKRYHEDRTRFERIDELKTILNTTDSAKTKADIQKRIDVLQAEIEANPYNFDRHFLFKILGMGHSQFAEFIGAKGPNTQVNAACASGTQAMGVAHDWIRSGRCRRVIVLSSDCVTAPNLIEWIGAGFLASGAATTQEVIEEAALPFDRRRHGLIMGMGAAAVVLEDAEAARDRGIRPITELMETKIANAAFHGSRIDVNHISASIEEMVSNAEKRWGVDRQTIAKEMVFVSHETYTPARGGSAQAEVNALRSVFGSDMNNVVVANTKGLTGHAMGTGIEDVLAVKTLETGVVPPVANFKEIDPELGTLNLSKGGNYPINYALRLAAGFGSQLSLSLQRWIPTPNGKRQAPNQLGYAYRVEPGRWDNWLADISGYDRAEVEVVNYTLRVKEQGPPQRMPRERTLIAPAPAPISYLGEAAEIPTATAAPVVKQAPTPTPTRVDPPKTQIATSALAPVSAPVKAASDPIVDRVLAIIAEQTGYPPEMLDPELDLEADLGIDTVKQAETFAAVREAYGIERDESIALRDFPTIASVVNFVKTQKPELATSLSTVSAAAKAAPAPALTSGSDPIVEKVLAVIAEQTGYPTEMLDLELDLEADLGIDTVKQAETFAAVREAYDIERDESIALRDFPTILSVVNFVRQHRPDLAQNVSAAPSAPATVAPAPVASTTGARSDVEAKVIDIVAEQTGYPSDMLDLDLDLEADLGVDTVKQAETFAAVREAFDIPQVENMQLRDFPTMRHVVQFVYDHRPELKNQTIAPQSATAPVATQAAIAAPGTNDQVTEKVIAIVAEQTGYPSDMLDLDLDLEADLGVDTVKQAETFAAVREAFDIPQVENMQLRDFPTMKHVIQFVYDHRPELKPQASTAPIAPTPVAPAPTTSAAVTTSDSDQDTVTLKVIEIVAEQTGYPSDMLDLDLDLEADLGVDTVKQAETFAAVREAFDIPQVENMQLRDFPTMKHVIQFVYDHKPELKPQSTPALSPTATSTPTPAPATDSANDFVRAKVIEIVAEQTGYPSDMLDLDLDLEADLGVDTVKQAETFAAVREAFDIPQVENMQLRDFPTMKHVIQFVYDHKPELRPQGDAATQTNVAPTATKTEPVQSSAAISSLIAGSMEAAAALPRRIPTPMLRPDLGVCKPTGVQFKDKRIVVMADKGGVATELERVLKAAGAKPLLIKDNPSADKLEKRLEGWIEKGPIHGVYWLAALDPHENFYQMSAKDFSEATRRRVKLLYATMRTLYKEIEAEGTFLVSGVRLGGQHGYDAQGATHPIGGAVVGFTKAFKREHFLTTVKAVDFNESAEAKDIASALIDETLTDPGVVEVGYSNGDRWTIGLKEKPMSDAQGMSFDKNSVYLITGAAGSIVSAITADLAKDRGGIFYLLDLAAEPDANNADLKRFAEDKEGLKREIFERLKAEGKRATPKMVEAELAKLERLHSALSGIEAVKAAGGTVHYHSVNLIDQNAVTKIIDRIRKEHGKIDLLLHAAGLEISRFLPDKEPKEFDLVFDVKVNGWFNLLSAIGDMPLNATVGFSSIAGRFGNGGQTDYSSANDLLCKCASSFRNSRTDTRGVSLDWTAWGGIGMATRGSIPKMMKLAGIDMLPPDAGVAFVRRELEYAEQGTEVVVAQGLGIMLEEFDISGGLDIATLNQEANKPMAANIRAMGIYDGLVVETELDPSEQPFLYDHQIDGTPVLPGVMGIEAFGELAKLLFKDWNVAAVEDVTFLAPFKFYRNKRRTLELHASFSREQKDLIASCKLVGKRYLPNAEEPQITVHFEARVRLTKDKQPKEKVSLPKESKSAIKSDEIYEIYFHGPAYRVLEKAWRDKDVVVGLMPETLPEDQSPQADQEMLPRLIELCFQTAGIWQLGQKGTMGLPRGVKQVRVLRDIKKAKGRLYSLVSPEDDGRFNACVADDNGEVLLKVEGYRTIELPGSVNERIQKSMKEAMQ